MKKYGLKEMKNHNKNSVINKIIEKSEISRTELAHATGLAPSTISSLVSELLEDGVIVETGEHESTGGRKRTSLSINPDNGSIVVVNVGRKSASMFIFDMCINQKADIILADSYISGNELLIEITSHISEFFYNKPNKKLLGIGLLFQKDMSPSDFNVVYSTSLSSANISLAEALFTQYKVQVTEEYSQNYSITDALKASDNKVLNSAHISLGRSVLASVTLGGTPINLVNGNYSDITPMLCSTTVNLNHFDNSKDVEIKTDRSNILLSKLFGIFVLIAGFFPLEKIILSGVDNDSIGMLKDSYIRFSQANSMPDLQILKNIKDDMADIVAHKIRQNIIYY